MSGRKRKERDLEWLLAEKKELEEQERLRLKIEKIEDEERTRKRHEQEIFHERKRQALLEKFRDLTARTYNEREEQEWTDKLIHIEKRLTEISQQSDEKLSATERETLTRERAMRLAEREAAESTWRFVSNGGIQDVDRYTAFFKERNEQFEGEIDGKKKSQEEIGSRKQCSDACEGRKDQCSECKLAMCEAHRHVCGICGAEFCMRDPDCGRLCRKCNENVCADHWDSEFGGCTRCEGV